MFLYGASGHARVLIDIILSSTPYVIDGVFDDDLNLNSIFEIPVINDISLLSEQDEILISIGDNKKRKNIVNKIKAQFISIIDKSAIVSNLHTTIGLGTVLMPNTVINSNSNIGMHCIINTSSVIEHDCILGDFVHLSPNSTLCGGVSVGEGSHIGAGATIIPGIKIGKWCIIGAGSTVIENVEDFSVVVGSPAKFIKKKIF